jgi:hypothetical protein
MTLSAAAIAVAVGAFGLASNASATVFTVSEFKVRR